MLSESLELFHVQHYSATSMYSVCEFRDGEEVLFYTVPRVFTDAHGLRDGDYFTALQDGEGIDLETIKKIRK